MLVLLGVLIASLFGFAILPAFWARAVRLTTQRLRQTLPMTEAEIRADRDRLKAEFAVELHRVSQSLEEARLDSARQQIELNRRDGTISAIERDLSTARTELEEHRNARRVLEQTIADRLPRVEQRLAEAKGLLDERDRAIKTLTGESDRTVAALDRAQQINAQQKSELDRLRESLVRRGSSGLSALSSEIETALRSEIESLRTKLREQTETLLALQRKGGSAAKDIAASADPAAKADGLSGLVQSRLAAKAKSSELDAELAAQKATIERLRADLAAANDRLSREAEAHLAEIRRLGMGTTPAGIEASDSPSPVSSPRRTLADRIREAQSFPESPAASPSDEPAPRRGVRTSRRLSIIPKDVAEAEVEIRHAAAKAADQAGDPAPPEPAKAAVNGDPQPPADKPANDEAAPRSAEAPRLMERLADIAKS